LGFRLRPQAEADIDSIALHIAADNPDAAARWVDQLYERCHKIADHPGIGVARSDVRPGLRMLPFGAYLILYRALDEGVEIVRVLHGARRWETLFRR
jgi:toxin ParE1/3/4